MKFSRKKDTVNNTGVRKTPLGLERRFDRFGAWLDTSWALRMAAPVFNRNPWIVVSMTWVMRLAVGVTFAVSGLAKAIDPWGTYYKMQEYLTAMHFPLSEWGNTVLAFCFFLFAFEFFIGVSLLTGCYRKATPIFVALFMLVMLPLTLWIALSDPVADCGCFGDFLVISNWATFIKNVLLSLAAVWLLKFNTKAACLISPYLQWIATVAMAAFVLSVGIVGYWQQPLMDFRQYKVGTRLLVGGDQPEYEPTFTFVYEKDGVEKEYGEDDDLPEEEDGWRFIRRVEKEFKANPDARVQADYSSDFRIWNDDATEDVTEYLAGGSDQLILFVPDITMLSMASSWKINRLYDIAERAGVEFFAVASGQPEDIDRWRDLSSGQYPIYTAQDTSIKELVRGNPGLVSIKDGVIEWKSALSAVAMDDGGDLLPGENGSFSISTFPFDFGISGFQILVCLSIILVAVLFILASVSHFPIIRR